MKKQDNNAEKRFQELLAFSLGVMSGEDVKTLIDKYKETIDSVTPYDIVRIEDRQLRMGIKPEQIKEYLEKIVNVITKSINSYQWEKPVEGTFLYYLMLENEAFTFKLNQVKKILKSYNGRETGEFNSLRKELLPRFIEFTEFESHYVKKENILFPYLEQVWEFSRPLKVMWSLDDDIRRTLKEVITLLESDSTPWDEFKITLGKFFFMAFKMIHKENAVVFPIASETVSDEMWREMHAQSFEYPFPFIEAPKRPRGSMKVGAMPGAGEATGAASDLGAEVNAAADAVLAANSGAGASTTTPGTVLTAGLFVSETGNLTTEQVFMAFNHLPVDITIVDEHDKVLFFNKGDARVFPRSPAVVGRAVQNCHPPESVYMVEEIIDAFRSGRENKADFWIQSKGKFIFIQYFALRDETGRYRGVIEVSHDVTAIRQLEGEQRLLDWGND